MAEEQDKSAAKYEGVAGCASSNCHGNVKVKTSTSVSQNEYQIWYTHDAHSQAYKDLLGASSKRIGEHLGIERPEEDALCLSCHSTYSRKEDRGERFRLEDGVGCESCHGPAENYIKTHTLKGQTHAQNIELGMTNLYNLNDRAKVCLDCHLGNQDKTVNHRLIGAGHPRLSFELDTYGILQPKHWTIDKDYTERKGQYQAFSAFLSGQIERSLRMLREMAREVGADNRMPELSNYYCYTCHHSLTKEEWKVRTYDGRPGELRLNLSSLLVLSTAIKNSNPELSEILEKYLLRLAHENSREKMGSEIREVESLLNKQVSPFVRDLKVDSTLLKSVVNSLVEYCVSNPFLPYEVAEQYAMGIFSCLSTSDTSGRIYIKEIKDIQRSLSNEKEFEPENFSESVSRLKKALK